LDSPVAVARSAVPSLVFLRSEIPARHPSAAILGEERIGAGVAVGADRVLTAHYLVLGASDVHCTGVDGKPRRVARVSIDHETGLALLALAGPALRPAVLGQGEGSKPGRPVFLLTLDAARERKGATGHVSSVGPFEAFWEYMLDHAITTTAVNPGLAGAPLFDAAAQLIGVVSLGLAAVGRYSLAIPVELYRRRQADLEKGEPTGRPRAWTGIYPQGTDGSVVLTGVVPDGPADRAGLARGDLVLSVDGVTVSSLAELYRVLWRRGPGDVVSFRILRDGALRVVEVVGGDRNVFYR
jgi:S1-C subfamily serine protease